MRQIDGQGAPGRAGREGAGLDQRSGRPALAPPEQPTSSTRPAVPSHGCARRHHLPARDRRSRTAPRCSRGRPREQGAGQVRPGQHRAGPPQARARTRRRAGPAPSQQPNATSSPADDQHDGRGERRPGPTGRPATRPDRRWRWWPGWAGASRPTISPAAPDAASTVPATVRRPPGVSRSAGPVRRVESGRRASQKPAPTRISVTGTLIQKMARHDATATMRRPVQGPDDAAQLLQGPDDAQGKPPGVRRPAGGHHGQGDRHQPAAAQPLQGPAGDDHREGVGGGGHHRAGPRTRPGSRRTPGRCPPGRPGGR